MDSEEQEILITANQYIINIKSGIKETAEFFQSYNDTKGSFMLTKIIDGIEWIINVLVSTKILTNDEIININDKLKEIVEALENEDYVLVGDLLFYELLPIMDIIEAKIKEALKNKYSAE